MFVMICSAVVYLLLKTVMKFSTKNCLENWFTRYLRRESNLRQPIVRFLIEGYLEFSLVALISLERTDAWQFDGNYWNSASTILAGVMLSILALTPLYLGIAAKKLLSCLDSGADLETA